jgi:hypothetical protein
LAANHPLVLAKRLRTGEIAMTRAAEEMMNVGWSQPEYDELMIAMSILYRVRVARARMYQEKLSRASNFPKL